MSTWNALYAGHSEARSLAPTAHADVRKVLTRFAARHRANATLPYQFTTRVHSGLEQWYINAESAAVALVSTELLLAGELVIQATVDRRRRHLHEFTAAISGRTPDEAPWAVAVHFSNDRVGAARDKHGAGAATHAAFHCHVGPTLDAEPKVRVPLPALTPADAVAWLLALIDPELEPAPWSPT